MPLYQLNAPFCYCRADYSRYTGRWCWPPAELAIRLWFIHWVWVHQRTRQISSWFAVHPGVLGNAVTGPLEDRARSPYSCLLSPRGVRLVLARTWKQPRCPSADEWIRKLRYIYTREYYSAIKKNTFESVLMRWMKLEPIIQSEVSQKEKHQYSILTHIYGI